MLAACRYFGATELTAHKVIVVCLESVNERKQLTVEDIRNTILFQSPPK